MLTEYFQTGLQFADSSPQAVILPLKRLIFTHHSSEFLLQFLEAAQPFLIDHRAIDVDRYFHLNLDWHFYLFLDFNGPINIYWLVHEDRLIHDDGIVIDWLIDIDWTLDYFWYFDFLDDHFGDLLFYFDVFGDLDDLLNDSFWARDVLGHFYFDLDWPLHHYFLHCFLGGASRCLLERLVLYFEAVLLSFEARNGLFVILAGKIALREVSQF